MSNKTLYRKGRKCDENAAMRVSEAIELINMRPSDRWTVPGYQETWDEASCALVLAQEVQSLRARLRNAEDDVEQLREQVHHNRSIVARIASIVEEA